MVWQFFYKVEDVRRIVRKRSEEWERDKKSEKEIRRDGTIKDSTLEDITLISNKDIFYFYYYTVRFKYYSVTIIFWFLKVDHSDVRG